LLAKKEFSGLTRGAKTVVIPDDSPYFQI